jgi:trafficking protein particle complex subunit 9
VLDVVNLTAQEMCLNYTSQKNILIEAKESCRVPVPVERCPIDRLLSAAEEIAGGDNVDTHCKCILLIFFCSS